jgi:hypothetical protein
MTASVVAFNQSKRQDQITKERMVQEAVNCFQTLMTAHGCEFVQLNGRTKDGRHFSVTSGRVCISDPDGVTIIGP